MMKLDSRKIKEFVKTHKKVIFFVALVIFITIYLLISSNKEDATITLEPTISSKPIATTNEEFSNNTGQAYYSNKIVTNNQPVTGNSWKGDKNIYSTKNGIYEAGTNNPIFTGNIEIIRWSDNFNAILLVNNVWNKLNYQKKEINEIPVKLTNPIINNNGNIIADIKGNTVSFYDTTEYKSKEIKFNEPVENVMFSKNGNSTIISTNYATISYFYKLDINFEITENFESNDNYILSSVSPDGNIIALTLNNTIVLSDFSKIVATKAFTNKSKLISKFKTDNEFIVIEKYKDDLDRFLDNIYLVSVSGKSLRLSDSKAIKNRISFDIPIMMSENGYVSSFVENNGKTWILALKSNLYPTYSVDGELVYSNLKPRGH